MSNTEKTQMTVITTKLFRLVRDLLPVLVSKILLIQRSSLRRPTMQSCPISMLTLPMAPSYRFKP